jgi:MFS family permease
LTVGLILIVTMVAFEALAVATILPLIESELGDLHLYGWVFSAFFLGNLVGIVVAGRAADRMKPVVPFLVGVVLFLIGLALGAAAGSMLLLVVARALQGLGAGALPAIAYVCIGRAYPAEVRPRMFALLSTAWVVPSLIGPALSGLVGETIGWRWVFAGLLPLVAIIAGVVVVAMRPLPAPETEAPDVSVRDALLVAGGAALLLAGLGADQLLALGALVVAGLAIGLPAYRRLTPAGTLRARPGLPAAIMLRGVLTFAFFSADAYVPLRSRPFEACPPASPAWPSPRPRCRGPQARGCRSAG